ncbi:hypothetical protein ACWEOZ_22810 [Actinoplanes sp. NPDC004185]
MPKALEPTDPAREAALDRIALWLSPEDLRWVASHCTCTDATAENDRETCGRIRFRANAALHKAGTDRTD